MNGYAMGFGMGFGWLWMIVTLVLVGLAIAVANIGRFVSELEVLPAYVTRGERGAGFAEVAAALIDAHRAA